jgi:AraC-like DNA-binding protein
VDYITEQRLSHARRLLATTEDKVVDVALAAGFGSVSRFHAAFLRGCRQTPRRFRVGLRISKGGAEIRRRQSRSSK